MANAVPTGIIFLREITESFFNGSIDIEIQ
jgi:hypothetical protein